MLRINLGAKLRRPFLFSCILSATLCAGFPSGAHASDSRWQALSAMERLYVDLLASTLVSTPAPMDGYSAPVTPNIAQYQSSNEFDRALLRAERRRNWQAMAAEERQDLMPGHANAKPQFDLLPEPEKAALRQQAMDLFGVKTPEPSRPQGEPLFPDRERPDYELRDQGPLLAPGTRSKTI